ncbi:ribosome biogenesis GTPase YlqF [Halobacillus kuroshimensis]|uniref:Ribosome biogenesis GTPase A n=1 Tax=Halobacillus kuroshimensis TaxID=302481 RepID=A0ABS3DSY6_9BACI|nr:MULTISPECIES: ribosome biogenesis GTPase YlqF [Halobacillus]MBN8234434.1 ribosome biogenesis GTPase YlqF [Halobacillus kuroshimensis]
MSIQWFPGHMAKAKREVAEKLKLVDFVIELVDARAPLSSQNPMLHGILQEKPKMVVLMKKDLADPAVTEQWIDYFQNKNIPAVAIEANQKQDVQRVVQKAKALGKEKIDKLVAKGIRPRASRAMIIGIPNVGKSTLINRLVNKRAAKTGDKPGVTTKQQWIKVKKEFELLDTPGILWPKFEEEEVGYRLASIGTIKDQILPKEDVAAYVLDFLSREYPSMLEHRFGLEQVDDMMDVFEHIGKKRGCLESGGHVNFEKVSDIILQDLRTGKLGLISLETPE